jgi:4-hydroxy-tetrahydrodipicolinate synthase
VPFPGIVPAVLAPFTEEDSIDVEGLRSNVEFLLQHGVHGFVVNGTMGEASSLSLDERKLVLDTVLEAVPERVPVLAGVSAPATRTACGYATQAREAGAAGVMCLPPINYTGTIAELTAFFGAVAQAAELPIMAYNNPVASGVDLMPDAIAAVASEVPGIVSVKECSGDARRIAALLEQTELEILVGGDDWALEGFAAGAAGWVSGVANVAPAECVALEEHVKAGRLEEARTVYRRLLPLARLDMTPWLVQYFKGAQDAVGLKGGPVRPPRLPLDEDGREILREAVQALQAPVAA